MYCKHGVCNVLMEDKGQSKICVHAARGWMDGIRLIALHLGC